MESCNTSYSSFIVVFVLHLRLIYFIYYFCVCVYHYKSFCLSSKMRECVSRFCRLISYFYCPFMFTNTNLHAPMNRIFVIANGNIWQKQTQGFTSRSWNLHRFTLEGIRYVSQDPPRSEIIYPSKSHQICKILGCRCLSKGVPDQCF